MTAHDATAQRVKLLTVLIVEDNPQQVALIESQLREIGVERWEVEDNSIGARLKLATGAFTCAIVDLYLLDGREAGFSVLTSEEGDGVFKIVLTQYSQYFDQALLMGARRFIRKDQVATDMDALRLALFDAALFVHSKLEFAYQSEKMHEFFRMVAIVARKEGHVLILGESGSGKELVARALHALGRNAGGPFVAVNCACLDSGSAEAELFGVAEGGFTGTRARPGVLELAHNGTAFFDEIGELAMEQQARLLRVLEHPDELVRHGAARDQAVRVRGESVRFRAVFATDRDPDGSASAGDGWLRGPLRARITWHVLRVPPLNDRRDDIPLLAHVFLRRVSENPNRLTMPAIDRLRQHDWTGTNVRGLWNVLSRALVYSELRSVVASASVDPIDIEHAIGDAGQATTSGGREMPFAFPAGTAMSLAELEAAYIERVVRDKEGSIAEAARVLRIGRNTLYDKLKRYGLDHVLRSRSESRAKRQEQ